MMPAKFFHNFSSAISANNRARKVSVSKAENSPAGIFLSEAVNSALNKFDRNLADIARDISSEKLFS